MLLVTGWEPRMASPMGSLLWVLFLSAGNFIHALQCLTLAPVVALQTEIQSDEHKEALAKAIYHLHRESTGTVDGDIQLLSRLIKE